jgi:hypothetical protein
MKWVAAGPNRVSIDLQTSNDPEVGIAEIAYRGPEPDFWGIENGSVNPWRLSASNPAHRSEIHFSV